jgi:hypothetical protein
MRAGIDAGIGDDELRRAKAVDEIARRIGEAAQIGDIERVVDNGAGEVRRRRAPGNEAQRDAGCSVVAGERLADAGRSAGDDDRTRCFAGAEAAAEAAAVAVAYLPFLTMLTR